MIPRRAFFRAILLPALLLVALGAAGGAKVETFRGEGKALEGDLVQVGGRAVRLLGIDAPDPEQTCQNRYGSSYDCFAIAKGVLQALVEGREVECTSPGRNSKGETVAECRVEGMDLSQAMVSRGWAFAFRSLSGNYQKAEAWAQSRKRGLWAGKVEKPWEWRSRRLRETAR